MINYVFKRYELKYALTYNQYLAVLPEIKKRLTSDKFGLNTIQSLYYDTENYRLIRESIERPAFKEKLRLRGYNLNENDDDIYVEMKRKYDGVVYKRRIACKEREVEDVLNGKAATTQIGRELEYFSKYYGNLKPSMLIIYDREAYYDENSDLRVTFDRNVRYRKTDLNFHTSLGGENLLPEDVVLMEVKTGSALPLWFCEVINKEKIVKTSFSKYGAAYRLEQEKINELRGKILCLNRFSATETLRRSAFSSL